LIQAWVFGNGHGIETVQILLGLSHFDRIAPHLAVLYQCRKEAVTALDQMLSPDWELSPLGIYTLNVTRPVGKMA
jgi:hypothetical protein